MRRSIHVAVIAAASAALVACSNNSLSSPEAVENETKYGTYKTVWILPSGKDDGLCMVGKKQDGGEIELMTQKAFTKKQLLQAARESNEFLQDSWEALEKGFLDLVATGPSTGGAVLTGALTLTGMLNPVAGVPLALVFGILPVARATQEGVNAIKKESAVRQQVGNALSGDIETISFRDFRIISYSDDNLDRMNKNSEATCAGVDLSIIKQ